VGSSRRKDDGDDHSGGGRCCCHWARRPPRRRGAAAIWVVCCALYVIFAYLEKKIICATLFIVRGKKAIAFDNKLCTHCYLFLFFSVSIRV
jgi:hypothetical protein